MPSNLVLKHVTNKIDDGEREENVGKDDNCIIVKGLVTNLKVNISLIDVQLQTGKRPPYGNN